MDRIASVTNQSNSVNRLLIESFRSCLILFFASLLLSTHSIAQPSDSSSYLFAYILDETALDSEVISGPDAFPGARIPDVSHIDWTNNFVVIYPKFNASDDLDLYFRIYNHSGNLVRGATLVHRSIQSDQPNSVGAGVDANSFSFAALYSLDNSLCSGCTKLRTKIFDSSGNYWCVGNVIDAGYNKAQDAAPRVMIHDTDPIVFSGFNRVEWFTTENPIRTDIDVMGSHSDFGDACVQSESHPVNSKYLLDSQDIEDDPEGYEYKMDAANVALNGDMILFVWTRPDGEVMGRLGDYIPSSKEVILGSEFLIGYGEPGGSVRTWSGVAGDPGSNRFLVAWDDPLDRIVGKFIEYDPFYIPPDPFTISQYPGSTQPADIAFLRSNMWVITWVAQDPVLQTYEVWARPFANQAPITDEIRVNSETSDAWDDWSRTTPRISRVSSSTTSRRFSVAWQGKEFTNNQWFSKTFLAILRFDPAF